MIKLRKDVKISPTTLRILVVSTVFLLGVREIQVRGLEGGENRAVVRQGNDSPGRAAQTEPARGNDPSSQKPGKKPNANALFRRHCQKCHGSDGTGAEVRSINLPEIPDFTSEKWQKGRNNAQLVASILDGKGSSMPPFADKLSNEEVKALAAFVRSFDLPESKPIPSTDNDFDKQFRQLSEQMKELRKQFRDLSKRPDEH
jgi:mono/diheme cytochrome c family protein